MLAYVVHEAGGPEALVAQEWPDPEPAADWVTIAVKAFGLNRAEAVTRAGGSGDAVPFPRVIGIEAVGEVVDGGGTDLAPGTPVATAMGGLGRQHDGSYAAFTQARRSHVFPLQIPNGADGSPLPWATVAAVPETFVTALGCLRVAGVLDADRPDSIVAADPSTPPRVLMRPGASALGLAVAQIVADLGGETIGVTRSATKAPALLAGGMTDVLVTAPGASGVADAVTARWTDGATAVIDTVASDESLADDLAALAPGGRVAIAGSLAASYGTAAAGSVGGFMSRPDVDFFSSEEIHTDTETALVNEVLAGLASGRFAAGIDSVIGFDELVDAHRSMEANAYAGKVVVDLSR